MMVLMMMMLMRMEGHCVWTKKYYTILIKRIKYTMVRFKMTIVVCIWVYLSIFLSTEDTAQCANEHEHENETTP